MFPQTLIDKTKLWLCQKTGVIPPNPAYFVWLSKHGSASDISRAAKNGADVNAMFHGAISALMYATANRRDIKILKTILDCGCNPNLQGANGETALMIACARGLGENVATLFIEHGADPALKDTRGRSAIDYAIDAKNFEAREALENHLKNHSL